MFMEYKRSLQLEFELLMYFYHYASKKVFLCIFFFCCETGKEVI